MKWLIRFLVAFAILAGIAWVVGMTLPTSHTATRSARFAASPAAVLAVIVDVDRYAEWRSTVERVVRLESSERGPAWREIGGSDAIAYEADTTQSDSKVVTRITDKKLPFGGSWEFQVVAEDQGTRLTITENGEVYSPLFRVMSRYVIGHTATIETYLKDLGARLGEETRIEGSR